MPNNIPTTLIALVLSGVLVFMVPLITLTQRSDNVAQANVDLIVQETVTEVQNTGKLTRANYENLVNRLAATGNTYDIDIQIGHLDESHSQKVAQVNSNKIGEDGYYYWEYRTQVLKQLGIKADNEEIEDEATFLKNDTIILKEGDIITVEAKNTNSTAAQTLKSSFIGFSNAGEYAISARSSGMVTVNGVKD